MSEIRPEWMPTRDELHPHKWAESSGWNFQYIESVIYRAAIKAQIAAFEEFRADTASGHARDRMDAKIKELQEQLGEAGR